MDLSSRIIVNLFKVQNVVDLSAEPTRLIAHHVLECEFRRSYIDASTTLAERKVAKHVHIISVKVGQSSQEVEVGGRSPQTTN